MRPAFIPRLLLLTSMSFFLTMFRFRKQRKMSNTTTTRSTTAGRNDSRIHEDHNHENDAVEEDRLVAKARLLANRWNNRTIEIRGEGGKIRVNLQNGSVSTSGTTEPPSPSSSMLLVVRAFPDILPPGAVAFQVVLVPPSAGSSPTKRNKNNAADDDDADIRYLTISPYGDECRNEAATALAEVQGIPMDVIPLIIDYAIDQPTGRSNFEGPGFNYTAMTATAPPPPITTTVGTSSTSGRGAAAVDRGDHGDPRRSQPPAAPARPSKFQLFTLVEPSGNGGSRCRRRNTSFPELGVRSLFGSYWRSQHWDRIVSQSPHLLGDETWRFDEAVISSTTSTRVGRSANNR